MKRLTTLMAAVVLALGTKAQVRTVKQAPVSIKTDGKLNDWEQPLSNYDPSAKIAYAVAADDGKLYICIKAEDQQQQVKMMRSGVKLHITLKNKKSVTLSYPLPLVGDPMPEQEEKALKADYARLKKTFPETHKIMRLEGFTSWRGPVKLTSNNSPMIPAVAWDSAGAMVFEYEIPLNEIYGINLTSELLSKPATLEIEVPALADMNSKNRSVSPSISIGTSVGTGFGGPFGTGVGVGFGGNPMNDPRGGIYRPTLSKLKFVLKEK